MAQTDLPSPANPLDELWQELAAADKEETARCSGAVWTGTELQLAAIGQRLIINTRDRAITRADSREATSFLPQLVLLQYLLKAQDIPLAGKLVTPQEFVGGEFFFRGPHAFKMGPLEEKFARDRQGFLAAGEQLGAQARDSGDASFTLFALPRIPLTYVLWCADEEFPAKISVLFDATAERQLAPDMLWTLVNLVNKQLLK